MSQSALPLERFSEWFRQAEATGQAFVDAMTLATVTRSGKPRARVVLYKGLTTQGEVQFFTNYRSDKGKELLAHPYAALVFHWISLKRQVRFEGKVRKLSYDESNAYFQSRPRDSQIGAWASDQSKPISGPAELERRYEEYRKKFEGGPVPCPKHWGGFALIPSRIEFWEDRPSRLHHREVFTRPAGGSRGGKAAKWKMQILSP